MTVEEALQHSTASVVQLVKITARMWVRNWVLDGTYTSTWRAPSTWTDARGVVHKLNVTHVRTDNLGDYSMGGSVAAVNAGAGGWFNDGTYIWFKTAVGTPFDYAVQLTCVFYFSDTPKVLDDIYWEPRLVSAPAISQRIEAIFGEVGQVGGGTLTFTNLDGFFDELEDIQWDAESVKLKIGVDLPGRTMAWADYDTIATWLIDSWKNDGDTFEFRLVEPKSRVKSKIPFDVFSRDDFPNLDDDVVGKPVPIAYGANYGVAPIVVDPGTKTFKVAGHAIKSFDGVRIKKNRSEAITRSTSTDDWLTFDSNVRRYYLADETVKVITFKGVATTEENDVDDVVSTAGRWAYSENYIYVRPPSGQDWSTGTVTIESEQSVPQLITTNFASVDVVNGEFTLGDDWAVGIDVAVDFRGKVNDDGLYLENAVDIIEDLLTLAGETDLDNSDFADARARLVLGTDEWNDEVHILRPSLYITDSTEILGIIGDINQLARSFVYSKSSGEYSIGVFQPQPAESLPVIDDSQIVSFDRSFSVSEVVSKVVARYQTRDVDGFGQTHVSEDADRQYVHVQANPVIEDIDLPTAFEDDAKYWAQSLLILRGSPLAKHEVQVKWSQMKLAPGNQVRLTSEARGIDEVLEVLEKRLDLTNKSVTLILGNLRGFEDSPGFWVADAAVLPTRFSQLTGYGAGSLVWNSSWDPEIKTWVRQNVGYWTDANGFANASDYDAHMASVWT